MNYTPSNLDAIYAATGKIWGFSDAQMDRFVARYSTEERTALQDDAYFRQCCGQRPTLLQSKALAAHKRDTIRLEAMVQS